MSSGSTVYLSRAAWEHLDAAQAIVDQHAASATNGICHTCGKPDPCPERTAAAAIISRYGLLPRRRRSTGTAPPSGAPETTDEFTWFATGLVGAR